MDDHALQNTPLGDVRQRVYLRRHRLARMVVPVHPRTTGDVFAYILLRLHRRRRSVPRAAAFLLITAFGLAFLMHLLTGRIFPNVRTMGVYLGSMTGDEARAVLLNEWLNVAQIELIDEERVWTARPHELGLSLDADAITENARRVGLAGIPFGYSILPTIRVDGTTLSQYTALLASHVDIAPMNASYQWADGDVVGVPRHEGRRLDLERTLERILGNPAALAENRRFELSVISVPPEAADPVVYIDQMRQILSQPLEISGYDPLTNESIRWQANAQTIASWFEATSSGLRIRERALEPLVDTLNDAIAPIDGWSRYIDATEASEQIMATITAGQASVQWRIRYQPRMYQVVAGDTASHIAEEAHIPFVLLQQSNPDRNLDELVPGDVLTLPAPDTVIPQN